MKKIIFSVLLLGTVITLSAQEVTTVRVYNPNNTVTTVTTVPPHIRTAFETTYPDVTVISWAPMNTWWRASYTVDNRIVYVYYNEAATDFRVALPVINNSVPEDVVATAMRLYGPALYGITVMKGADETDIYQVRLVENGTTRVTWMDSNGTAVSNVFKTSDVVVNQ